MSLPTCSSCGRLIADVVMLEHKGKEWRLGKCCFSTPEVEIDGAAQTQTETKTKGRK